MKAEADLNDPDAMEEDLQHEVELLKREVDIWRRRADRAEQEVIRWKTTANAWRHEFMKRSATRSPRGD